MKTRILFVSLLAIGCSMQLSDVAAQVVRESDAKSIAGVIYSGGDPVAFKFKSAGGEILFASLSADIYRMPAEHEEGHDTEAAAEEGGGCGGEDEGGGPGRFLIEVLDEAGATLCYAERPAPPPGWMRDPRLACILPSSAGQLTYTVQVGLRAMDHEEPTVLAAMPKPHPFLLDLSLRKIGVSGTLVQTAVAQSKNKF
jgi:hypothetical protein